MVRISARPKLLAAAALAGLLLVPQSSGPQSRPPASGPPAEVGFSFSPVSALALGEDPSAALATLLDRIQPDVVRLPVYWSEVAPTASGFDFAEVDAMLAVVAAHNLGHPDHLTGYVLVVGARNLGYPELYLPAWAESGRSDLGRLVSSPSYLGYVSAVVTRYSAGAGLAAWQVENEPFDDISPLGEPADNIPPARLTAEVGLIHRLDAAHRVIVTSYDSASLDLDERQSSPLQPLLTHLPIPQPAGHAGQAMAAGDVLGLDAYVVTPSTPLREVGALQRIAWKGSALSYWSTLAAAVGKDLWVTEMEAAPWSGTSGFVPADLFASARLYSNAGARAVLLWGVEEWLVSPGWLAAGTAAAALLRGQDLA